MGLLDDAIREHLELKRQRGADPEDVEREEREALGPVVRGDDLVADVASGEAEGFPSEYEAPASELDYQSEPEQPPLAPHIGQPTEEFDVESAQELAAAEPAPAPAPDPEPEPEREREPEPAAEPEHAPAQSHHPPAPGEEEHDVLEDTPDFLQETPEHDRLWFEQAPPQDFDFDK